MLSLIRMVRTQTLLLPKRTLPNLSVRKLTFVAHGLPSAPKHYSYRFLSKQAYSNVSNLAIFTRYCLKNRQSYPKIDLLGASIQPFFSPINKNLATWGILHAQCQERHGQEVGLTAKLKVGKTTII